MQNYMQKNMRPSNEKKERLISDLGNLNMEQLTQLCRQHSVKADTLPLDMIKKFANEMCHSTKVRKQVQKMANRNVARNTKKENVSSREAANHSRIKTRARRPDNYYSIIVSKIEDGSVLEVIITNGLENADHMAESLTWGMEENMDGMEENMNEQSSEDTIISISKPKTVDRIEIPEEYHLCTNDVGKVYEWDSFCLIRKYQITVSSGITTKTTQQMSQHEVLYVSVSSDKAENQLEILKEKQILENTKSEEEFLITTCTVKLRDLFM
jgi:hypothetical protein